MLFNYKKYTCLLMLLAASVLFAQEPEIIIELTGAPEQTTAPQDIAVWENDSSQLAKQLRGKTREQALYLITSVSTKDTPLRAADGTRYRLVQYGREGGYRKLLFLARTPQLFIDCASNTLETLDLIRQYQVTLGLTEAELLEDPLSEITAVPLPITNGQTLYELNTSEDGPQFLLFKDGLFAQLLTKKETDRLIQTQQETLAEQQKKTQDDDAKQPPKKTTFRAIVEGGSLHDQLYLPRVVSPQPASGTDTTPAPARAAADAQNFPF